MQRVTPEDRAALIAAVVQASRGRRLCVVFGQNLGSASGDGYVQFLKFGVDPGQPLYIEAGCGTWWQFGGAPEGPLVARLEALGFKREPDTVNLVRRLISDDVSEIAALCDSALGLLVGRVDFDLQISTVGSS